MTETTITRQIVEEAPEIQAYKLGLFQDAQKYIRDLQAAGIQPPAQGVAGFTAEQLAAGDIIRSGIGGYEDYLGGALRANQAAQQLIAQGSAPLLQESLAQQQAGISGLEQARQLAIAQRQAPFQIRNQALRGLSGAAADIARAGAGVGSQVFAAQQGLGRAGRLGQRAVGRAMPATQRAQREAALSGFQAGQLAGQGIRSIGQAQQGIAGQVGDAQLAQQLAALRARQSTAAAQGQLRRAGQMGQDAALAGIGQLGGSAEQFDPSGIAAFMDPFTREVIEAEQAEIARLGEKQLNQARAQQAAAGAFGGSRGAIQEAEIGRNVLEQQARTGAQLRSQGFQQAAQQAQAAFEAARGRQQRAAQLTGALGQQGAGTALQAAQQAGQLGLSAEQLAQTGALQGGQLGLRGQTTQAQLAQQAAALGISTEQLQAQLAQQAAQTAQQQGRLGLSAAELAQRGAQAGGALGLQGQQALAQMAGQRANIAQQGGQLGLQFGQLAQRDVDQLAALAQQRGAMGQGIAGLALQGGQLAGQLGSLGGQQAALGQQAQRQRAADVQQLLQFGGMGQQQAQNVLNAQFAAEQAAYNQPLAQLGFLGDLTKALPSSQSAVFQQQAPSPSLAQTAGGLALGAAGLARVI